MKAKKESKTFTPSMNHANLLFFVGCFATAIMTICGAIVLCSGTIEAQLGSTDIGSTQNVTNMSSINTSASLIDFDSNIEQIRGHLQQAVANKELGNTTLAKAHTLHPIDEIYNSIEAEITAKDPSLNQSLSSALDQLSNMVDNSTVKVFRTKASDINTLLNDTVGRIVPAHETGNSGFNLIVVGNLLSAADKEYEEAIVDGQLKEIVEYQDGQAFISRANSIFNESLPMIPQEMSANVPIITGFFADLMTAVKEKSNPDVVSNAIGSIVHEISKITGTSEENISGTGNDTSTYIPAIRNLLNQTIDAYENQNFNEADTLAIQAYLDNYEFIEAPLGEQNNTLMKAIEVLLREDLRQLIQAHAPLVEVQQLITNINSDLNQAEKLLETS